MPFKDMWDYRVFAEQVIDLARYRYSPENEEFLRAIEDTGLSRTILLPRAATLYRAQLHHRMIIEVSKQSYGENPIPSPPDRMKPIPKSAREGRVNPKGIPCLYLADGPDTAMSEVRPWIGAYVSIGRFETLRDLRMMDCTITTDVLRLPFEKDFGDQDREGWVWNDLSSAFSEPVTDSDTKADYAPTQVLAEVFKRMGCDGIKYRSLLGEGGNSFAIFNLNDARLVSCGLCSTEKITHMFSKEFEAYDVAADGSEMPRTR